MEKKLISLGIESTAHTFGVGIVNEKAEILANEKATKTTVDSGLIPRELAEHHSKFGPIVLEKALDKAGLKGKEIDVISFSQGPGIGPALSVGATLARSLALGLKKPIAGVNHCIAHIEIGKALTKARDAVIVYASGANTQVIAYENKRYRIFGETLDIGVGNMLDSFGREFDMGFPAGPIIDKLYFEGKNYAPLPYSVKGMDFAFAGLQTSAENKIGKVGKEDLCYSLMHNAFAMLTEVAERALAHTNKKELLLTGGVAASKALREMMGKMCENRGTELFVPPASVCVDNGAMIAWQGLIEFRNGRKMKISETEVDQKQRTDEIEVNWL